MVATVCGAVCRSSSGHNKLGRLLSMPQMITKIERFKCMVIESENLSKKKEPSGLEAESISFEGGMSELKHVVGQILSRMQKGMDGLQHKYVGEMFMMDDDRNRKLAAQLLAECGIDLTSLVQFEALKVAVVCARCNKLSITLMSKTIGDTDKM